MKYFFWVVGALLSLSSCTDNNESTESTLGLISFTPHGTEIAQPHFQQGLLLMHNFEYEDARTSFLEALKLDSNFHMAYWGGRGGCEDRRVVYSADIDAGGVTSE